MRIVTSQNLFKKYPGHQDELMGLLNAISSNIDVLPICDYVTTKMHCDTINDSILIVGNDDVVPFGRVGNPAADNDSVVPSDSPYACIKDPMYLIPDKVIARIPDEMGNATFDYISVVLKNQAKWSNNKSINIGWFNIVASVWKSISDYMKQQFSMNDQNVAPPMGPNNISVAETLKKFAYINLHGTQQTQYYYGQLNNTYPIALQPASGNFAQCLLFIEACYGGYTIGRAKDMSIPMTALYSNAIGTVSSTTVAYGTSSPPAQCADLLAECFYNRINSGNSLGEALMNAKNDFATQTIKQFGSLNGASRKTLLQFHLYGNPDIKI